MRVSQKILSFIIKEFKHVFRDWKTLFILFGMPIAQILIFGFALTNEIKNTNIVIIDQAHDAESTKLIHKIEASRYFDIISISTDITDMDRQFKSGNIKLAVIIPPQFQQYPFGPETQDLQIIADASDPNTATILRNYIEAIVADFNAQHLQSQAPPIRILVETKMMYNPQLKGAHNFVPGVMALILMLICVMMTAVSIVKEKELGTMEILLASPSPPILIIFSKTIPYLFLSLINVTSILILSVTFLEIPILGNIALLYAESFLFIMTCLAIGIFISINTDSQQVAMLISLMGMMLPTILFSGFMFPIENMPVPLQIISNIIPAKWYYIINKNIMLKGLGFESIIKPTVILFAIMVFFTLLSLKKFKVRLT